MVRGVIFAGDSFAAVEARGDFRGGGTAGAGTLVGLWPARDRSQSVACSMRGFWMSWAAMRAGRARARVWVRCMFVGLAFGTIGVGFGCEAEERCWRSGWMHQMDEETLQRERESDGADGDTLASSREIEFDLRFGALIEC